MDPLEICEYVCWQNINNVIAHSSHQPLPVVISGPGPTKHGEFQLSASQRDSNKKKARKEEGRKEEEEEGRRKKTTDIKSNNPHLTGGEKHQIYHWVKMSDFHRFPPCTPTKMRVQSSHRYYISTNPISF